MKEHLCLLVCTRALLVSICRNNSRGLLLCKSKYAEVVSEHRSELLLTKS